MTKAIRAACLLLCASLSSAALGARRHPAPPHAAPPSAPEPGWALARGKEALKLFYGMPDGTDTVIAFDCVPRSGDVLIHVPATSGKLRADRSQSVSLTIGGVKSSFAATVTEGQDGGVILEVTVSTRNPMFTSLGGPGGMRIETKGATKIVPLRGIGEKLRPFIAGCRK